MKKNIKVIIKKPNTNLGPIHSIKQVAFGYAFNYLIPQKIADIATPGKVRHVKMLQKIQYDKQNKMYENNLKIKNDLEQIRLLTFRKKIGSTKQIFGSITESEVLEKVFNLTTRKLEKKQLQIPQIKQIGSYIIKANIDNISTELEIHILPHEI